ncbi:acyltransferase family protein [Salipiger bermudensis]|uniref:acyltransferase family protein n=1 Tax=Salipiger bermudensis TaxID=344736 RepID=UPI001CD66325|nr:acyltransferase [Salipiger bermudensis]MCA0964022.1 acyltransferase [Salipiger bermudensis]
MNKIYGIQYLRAFAALSVVALHAGKRVEADLPAPLYDVLSLGHGGVDLFFVISGFIMWSISQTKETDPAGFLVRRLIRVAPPYWIATLCFVLMSVVIGASWVELSGPHIVKSLAFVPHFNATEPTRIWPVLVPGWTLNYEMFFYMLFAATLLVGGSARFVVLTGLLLALVALGYAATPVDAIAITYTSPLLLEFLGGVVGARIWQSAPGGLLRNGLLIAMAAVAFLVLGPQVDPTDYWSRTIGFGGPGILLVSGVAGLAGRVPRLAVLERLGDASYAIYLFHLFVVLPMQVVWVALPGLHGPVAAIGFVLVVLGLSALLGNALYLYMERPLQIGLFNLLLHRNRRAQVVSR